MAKRKLVLDDAQLSRIAISNAANGKNIVPVAPAMKNENSFSSTLSRGRSNRRIEDEMLDDEVTEVATTEQATPADNVVSDPEQLILLAKADVTLPPTPNTAPVTVGQKGTDLFSSQTSNWWAGGLGLAALGTGVGFALSRDDSNNTNNPVSAISDSNVAANSVAENATTGTVVGITVLATDVDDGATISYSLSDNAGGRFAIDATTGVVTVADGNLLDFETVTSHDITVLVTSSDGSTNSQQFTINVSNDNDPVSTIIDSNVVAANVVAENATIGTVVGITALATDVDDGATISYSLSDNAGGRFAINALTGVITVADGTLLDYESVTSHDVTVLASSSDGSTNSQQFAIGLTNVNEHFVVEAYGAWIDLNANGVRDAEDTLQADFTPGSGNVDLAAIPVTVHFNDAPENLLNLSGFGSDDLIEIDVQAFIDHGHNALNILSIPGIKTLDEFSAYTSGSSHNNNSYSFVYNTLTRIGSDSGSSYANSNRYSGVSGSLNATIGLRLLDRSLATRTLVYFSASPSAGTTVQLASGLPTDMLLQDMVDFVNPPVQPATTHVVVDQDGAVIDIDGDGVHDNGENRLAVFADGGNADLSNKSVVVHFNEIPLNALDLSGFGSDDKIEFDVQDMRNNFILTSSATRLANISTANSTVVRYAFNSTSSLRLTVMQTPGTVTTFNSSVHSNAYALQISTMWTSVNGKWNGAFAYWTDTGNVLNNANNILPGYTGSNTSTVLSTLNSNAPHIGLIDFVWPVNVVVDDQTGNVATFIDANANGVRDAGEDTLALLGQTQADVDAFNTTAGTSYGSQAVDLASEQVSIHYNDLPNGVWVPDMTGFNGNDRFEIDIAAMFNNIAINDTVTLNNQPTRTMSSQTQFYASASGVSSGNTAVYLSGGNLKFGHRATTTSFTGSATVFNTHYTATGTLQGVIASNANPIANNFQQVVFVTSIV